MRIITKSYTKVYTAKPDEGMELAVVPWQPAPAREADLDRMIVPSYDLDLKIDSQALVQHVLPARESCSRYCALRKLAFEISSPSDLSRYPWELRKGHFLDWAYERVCNSSILRQERFTCPLLWCRRLFDSPRMLLQHIEVCDRLAEGEYWCYEHAGPERFAPLAPRQKSQLKLSKCIRHAVRIIRKLGPRRSKNTVEVAEFAAELAAEPSSPKRFQPSPTADYIFVSAEEKTPATNRLDAELSTLSCELKELPATHSRYYEPRWPLLISDAPALPVFSTEAMDVDQSDCSRASSCRSISPIQEGYHVIDRNPLSPMSPYCDASPRTRRFHFEEMELESNMTSYVSFPSQMPQPFLESDPVIVVNTVETIPNPTALYLDVQMTSDFAEPDEVAATSIPPEGPVLPLVYSDEKILCAVNIDSPHYRQTSGSCVPTQYTEQPTQRPVENVHQQQSSFGSETQMRTQLALVEGLRRVSMLLYKRSIRNLRRDRLTVDVRLFIRNMPPCELIVAKGLAALRKVFAGSLPSTLMEVYAMLHVTYVAAIVINQKEVEEVLNDLYADILNWSLAIKSVRERALFVDIARRIWACDKHNCPRQVTEDVSGALNQPCFTTVLPAMSENPRSSPSGSGKSKASASSRDNIDQATTLFNNLKNGTAIYLCRQYLDILEYTGLLSGRRGPYLGQLQGCSTTIISREESTTASYWDSKITTPLIIFMGLEGFQSIIINVQKLIVNGVFHNLREVELKLMYDGQHCSRSPARYHSFLKLVRRLCKEAQAYPLHQPFSHDTQYMRDIDVAWRFHHALNQKSAALAPGPVVTGCQGNPGRMTNKDLPRLETHSRVISSSSDSSKATSSSSASANTVPSAFSGETVFSQNSAASSNSSYSFIPTPRKDNGSSPCTSTPSHSSPSYPAPSAFAAPSTPAPRRRPSRAPSSGASPGGISYCPQCNEPFTGLFHKTNLNRHIKSVHGKKKIPCPFGGCQGEFTRSDNLGTHQKNFAHW